MLELNKIYQGDCLEVMKTLQDNSVDAIVTDPPYGLEFMGKEWDKFKQGKNIAGGTTGEGTPFGRSKPLNSVYQYGLKEKSQFQQFTFQWATEALRVLKPGGHLLSFGGTRTYHRMACAIEDAGFEIRDMIEWVYGSGFPKSLNIGKAVDELQGNEREEYEYEHPQRKNRSANYSVGFSKSEERKKEGGSKITATKGTSEWEGWGTALKPAHEPIVLARKPLAEKTVAENVLKFGTGGINIDGCRIGNEPIKSSGDKKSLQIWKENDGRNKKDLDLIENTPHYNNGRFPANLIHDGSDEVVVLFPKNKGAFAPVKSGQKGFGGEIYGKYKQAGDDGATFYGDGLGSSARFFYCAKASKSERNFGCEELSGGKRDLIREHGQLGTDNAFNRGATIIKNNHPTVKPIALMEYLIKLITPKQGIVLDPFIGSGTTAIACLKNGFKFIGIEKEEEYIKIANARLKPYLEQQRLN